MFIFFCFQHSSFCFCKHLLQKCNWKCTDCSHSRNAVRIESWLILATDDVAPAQPIRKKGNCSWIFISSDMGLFPLLCWSFLLQFYNFWTERSLCLADEIFYAFNWTFVQTCLRNSLFLLQMSILLLSRDLGKKLCLFIISFFLLFA